MDRVVEKIEKLRVEKGWTINMLATRAGLEPKTVYRWYEGTTPTYKALSAVAEAYNISIVQLLCEDNVILANEETVDLMSKWNKLSSSQKSIVLNLVNELIEK